MCLMCAPTRHTQWEAVSDDAKDMIRSMLVVDPRQRATAGALLKVCRGC
jgi:hypothetical protein